MKRICTVLLLACLFYTSCSSNKKESQNAIDDLVKTTLQPFSDSVLVDTFKVDLVGSNPDSSILNFSITSHEGKEIYKTEIKASNLYKDNKNVKSSSQKLKFIKAELEDFFNEEHFLWPAVMPDEVADKNVADKLFYNELKTTQLNGFFYPLSPEAKVYIAWSVSEKKVKTYYETKDLNK